MALSGQQVVVIGGSSGMGLAVARMARAEGAVVTIAGRTPGRLAEAQRVLAQDEGEPAAARVVDVADEASVAALFDELTHVDHVLISAGTLGNGAIMGNDLDALRRIVEERLWGVVYAVRAAAPKMTGGSITVMSGGIAARPRVGAAMYTAILSAVEALAPALALELAPTRVNCVTPGLVDTPLLMSAGPEARARVEARGATLPAGRIGQPEDVAQVILMLMQNAYITGEVIHVDGGGRYA